MRLSEQINKKQTFLTPYQVIAKDLGVSAKFVGMVARGEREPVRGIGLEVKKRLEALVGDSTINK